MDKKLINNIVASVNLFLGVCYIFAPLIPLLITLPKVDQFYSSVENSSIVKPAFSSTYIFLGIIMLMGVISLLFGFKGIRDKNKTKKYLSYGIVCAVVTFFLGGILAVLALMPVTSSIYDTARSFTVESKQSTSNPAIDLINQERLNSNLKKIEVDEKLCELAQLIADDSEVAYPKEVSIRNNPKYKPYLEKYTATVATRLTPNDMLIKPYKDMGEKPPFSYTEEEVAQKSIESGEALTPEITHGCIAVSSGNLGYKQFAFFIGGVKK